MITCLQYSHWSVSQHQHVSHSGSELKHCSRTERDGSVYVIITAEINCLIQNVQRESLLNDITTTRFPTSVCYSRTQPLQRLAGDAVPRLAGDAVPCTRLTFDSDQPERIVDIIRWP